MIPDPVQTPLWLDLAAVTTSALGGSLVAVRAKFDVTGVVALGILTGLGGGLLRDILLNQLPVALKNPWYIVAAVISPVPAILVGLIAGLGGGIICDLMTTKPPAIFQRGHLYATAAFAGLVLYVIAIKLGAPANETAVVAALIIFGLRIAARSRDWKAPQPVDVPHEIRKRLDSD